jgi:hypothetical protein
MNKKINSFLLLLIYGTGYVFCQTAGKQILMTPLDYGYPTGDIANASAPAEQQRNSVEWFVFSDRNDNPSYRNSDGKDVLKKMNFLDAFIVIGQTDDYVHIAKTDKGSDIDRTSKTWKLRNDLQDYGWAPKSKMLLWRNALVDRETRFTIKALAVNSPETLMDVEKYAQDDKLKIFTDPLLRTKSDNDVRLYNFMYVFKKEGNSLLIAKTVRIDVPTNVSTIILGWVDKKIITEWNQRLVLEPNWDKTAAQERKGKNVMPSIYSNPEAAKEFKLSGLASEKPIWTGDKGQQRFAPEWKRLPILGTLPNDIIKTGVVSAVFDMYGNEKIATEEQVQIQKEYNDTRDKFRKINIVFVVDGNEIMRDYLADVYNMIYTQISKHGDNSLEGEQDANKFRMGAVVYRDYSFKTCPDGDISIQKKSLTPDLSQLRKFISDSKVSANCSDRKEYYTNMYQGIETALRMFDGLEKQTNIVVLVGSGGNRRDDNVYVLKRLTDMMIKYDVSLLGFQVKNNGQNAQYDFPDQVSELIKESVQGVRKKMKDKQWINDKMLNLNNRVFVQDGLKFRLLDSSPIPGTLMSADVNNPVRGDSLNAELDYIVDKMLQSKEEILQGLEAKLNGIGKREVLNEGMLLFLSNMNVDVNLLMKSSMSNIQFFTEAYTSIKCDKLYSDLYKYCVFMTSIELGSVTAALNKIFDTNIEATQQRINIKDAFKEIMISYFGAEKAKKALRTMSADKIMTLITGLPSKSKILAKYKVDDFADPKKVTEQELAELLEDVTNKKAMLELQQANPEYYFRNNDQSWYWIPQDYLP